MELNWATQIKQLYKKEFDRLFRVAYRMTGDVEASRDFVQETFVMALFQRETLSAHPALSGWLMVTLRNLIQNDRRREKPISLEEASGLPVETMPQSLDEILPTQLPKNDRELLIWRFEQNLSYQEIAERKGISEGACRTRVSRAVAKCRELLSEEDFNST